MAEGGATKAAPVHTGYLTKKGGIRHNWLQRWCELHATVLEYYEVSGPAGDSPPAPGTLKLKGEVLLAGTGEEGIRPSEAPRATEAEFEIRTPDRTWRFRAASKEHREEWMAALRAVARSATDSAEEQKVGLATKFSNWSSGVSYSAPVAAAADKMGVQLHVPGEQGAFAPHSDASFVCLDVQVSDRNVDGFKTGSIDAEFYDDMVTRRNDSKRAKETFGVTRESKGAIRCSYGGEGLKLALIKHDLDGLNVSLGPTNNLDIFLCTYMPINAPVGLYKDSAKVSSSNGDSAKPVVIQPDCRLVDLYVTVDGVAYEETVFCCGEGSNDDAAAKQEALKKCYDKREEPLTRQITSGVQGSTKPWVTIFSTEFCNENYIYLPLMLQQGGDLNDVMVDQVKGFYAEGLMRQWSTLLGVIGPGQHTFELRISPRCVINPVPGEGEGYHEELCVIQGHGKTSGLNTDGSPGTILRENMDPTFNQFCKVWEGQDITPEEQNPLFRATFTLNLDPTICTGKGPERLAEEFDKHFNDDIGEYCMIAYELSGARSGPAREAFGCSPGKPAHIVLPERANYRAGNVFDQKNEKDGHEYRDFLAIAYWLHPNGGDDDEGVSTDIYMKKYTVRSWCSVPNPKFEVITPGSEWGVADHSVRITNRQIRLAIERDASLWNLS